MTRYTIELQLEPRRAIVLKRGDSILIECPGVCVTDGVTPAMVKAAAMLLHAEAQDANEERKGNIAKAYMEALKRAFPSSEPTSPEAPGWVEEELQKID